MYKHNIYLLFFIFKIFNSVEFCLTDYFVIYSLIREITALLYRSFLSFILLKLHLYSLVICWSVCVCVCVSVCVHVFSHSVVSDSLQPYGLQSAKFLCSWTFPSKNNEVCCHFPLQVIFFSSKIGDKGIKSTSLASLVLVVWFFTTESPENPHWSMYSNLYCLLSQTFSSLSSNFLRSI